MFQTSKRSLALAAVSAGVLLACRSPAGAATTQGTFTVTATVNAACTITTNNLAFGSYTGVQLDGTTNLLATCSTGTGYDIGLNAGTFSGANVLTRRMTGPDATGLGYSLFQDPTRQTNWGNTVNTDTVHDTGNGAAQTHTVYGRIPAGEFVTAGAYTDTITVTLTF
jgi:spore coat protein U-like protein